LEQKRVEALVQKKEALEKIVKDNDA